MDSHPSDVFSPSMRKVSAPHVRSPPDVQPNNWSSVVQPFDFLNSSCSAMYPTQVLGIITWKYSAFALDARLIFTCGQWNRWCERRICHAWLSGARLFLSTFWQDSYGGSHAVFAECLAEVWGAAAVQAHTDSHPIRPTDNPARFIVFMHIQCRCWWLESGAFTLTHAG